MEGVYYGVEYIMGRKDVFLSMLKIIFHSNWDSWLDILANVITMQDLRFHLLFNKTNRL